jgi:hypothetical protein
MPVPFQQNDFVKEKLRRITIMPRNAVIWFILILCIVTACSANRYLQRDAQDIRTDLLREYPLGSTINDIEAKLKMKNIERQVSRNAGFLKQEKGNEVVVGAQSIRAHLGTYRSSFFSHTSVTVFWGFDKNSELIDIWVWKTTDTL